MTQHPDTPASVIVLGIDEDQAEVVAATTAALAARLGAEVVCVNVQSGRLITQRVPEPLDEAPHATGFDDGPESDDILPLALQQHLDEVFAAAGVTWRAHRVEGDPGKALARVADDLDALMIVVGTRRPGLRSRVEEFLDGSVAVHLSHRQSRPVLVIPQVPNETGLLPWEN